MEFEKDPIQIGEAKRKHILSMLGHEDNMEKALSKDQFNEKYGVGYDVFTIDQLAKFDAEAKEKDGDTDEVNKAIQEEFATFSPVLVKGTEKGGVEQVFVRESKTDPESEEEEGSEEE